MIYHICVISGKPGSFTSSDGHTGKSEAIANVTKIVKIGKNFDKLLAICYINSPNLCIYHPC